MSLERERERQQLEALKSKRQRLNEIENRHEELNDESKNELNNLRQNTNDLVNFFTIECPPSLLPTSKYCDITGLKGNYCDPKTRLRYNSIQVYDIIKQLQPSAQQQFLSIRKSETVLK